MVANFFSFFTIESNVLSVLGLAAAAVWSWTHRGTAAHPPLWLTVLLTAATAYMLVTGVVYNTLLRGWYGRRPGRRFDADAGVLPPTGRSSVTQ